MYLSYEVRIKIHDDDNFIQMMQPCCHVIKKLDMMMGFPKTHNIPLVFSIYKAEPNQLININNLKIMSRNSGSDPLLRRRVFSLRGASPKSTAIKPLPHLLLQLHHLLVLLHRAPAPQHRHVTAVVAAQRVNPPGADDVITAAARAPRP